MTCPDCRGVNDDDALYCIDCGRPFYVAEWAAPTLYVGPDGTVEAKFRVHNRGEATVRPTLLRVRGAETVKAFEPNTASFSNGDGTYQHTSFPWRDRPATRAAPVALELLASVGEIETALPLAPVYIVPQPVVELFRPADPDLGVREASLTRPDGDGADPLPLPFRQTRDYRGSVIARVTNDSVTRVRQVTLQTPSESQKLFDQPLHANGRHVPEPGDPLEFPIDVPLSWADHDGRGSPEAYTLVVEMEGLAEPVKATFAPRHRTVPTLQVLVQRPTAYGFAYVGMRPIENDDLSIDLDDNTPVTGRGNVLDREVLEAFAAAPLLPDTVQGLNRDEITWRVPAGVPRTRRVAIDHLGSADFGDLVQGHASVAFGDVEHDLGPVTIPPKDLERGTRAFLAVPIPPLSADTAGTLRVTFDGDRSLELALTVRVFKPVPYPAPVAVDFGTTNSCVAMSPPKTDRRGNPTFPSLDADDVGLLPLGAFREGSGRQDIVPTRVQYGDEPWPRIGHEVDDDEPAFDEVKLDIDRDDPIAPDPEAKDPHAKRTPRSVATDFLHELLRRANEYHEERGAVGCRVVRLTCSLPTTFSERKRQAIAAVYREAQERLGAADPPIGQIDESMAAFVYARKDGLEAYLGRDPALVLVYDFGGGTTDITVLFSAVEGQRRTFVEIAAGGDPTLGGGALDDHIAATLLRSTSASAKRIAEEFKKTAEIPLAQVQDQRDAIENLEKELFGTPVADTTDSEDGDEPRMTLDVRAAAVLVPLVRTWLKPRVEDALAEVLDKATKRLPEHFSDLGAGPLSLHLLPAGNSSALSIMKGGGQIELVDLLREVVDEWAKQSQETVDPLIGDVRVWRLRAPKASVAMGAFLTGGDQIDVDRPYAPHHSYWLRLPFDAYPDEEAFRVQERGGQRYAEVVPEGAERPYTTTYDPDALGLGRARHLDFYRAEGVSLEWAQQVPLPPPPHGASLQIDVSDDEILDLSWA